MEIRMEKSTKISAGSTRQFRIVISAIAALIAVTLGLFLNFYNNYIDKMSEADGGGDGRALL